MICSTRVRSIVMLVLGAIALIAWRPLETSADTLAAASGRHVFVVRPGIEESGWEVVHLDADAGPERFRTVFRTPRRPEAIAAEGDRCILVLAPQDADRPSRLAISFRVSQHPLNDVWFADPPGDPRVLPPLPSGGEPAGIASTPSVEMVVHRPSQRVARGVARPSSTSTSDRVEVAVDEIGEAGAVHVLRSPARRDWIAVQPPASFTSAIGVAVGTVDLGARVLPAMSWRSADGTWEIAASGEDGEWRMGVVHGLGEESPVSLAAMDGRTLLALRSGDGGIRIVDLIRGGTAVATDPEVLSARPFTVASAAGVGPRAIMVCPEAGPWLVGLDGSEIRIQTVDRGDGRLSGIMIPVEQEVAGTLVAYPLYAGVAMFLIVVGLMLRPHFDRQPAILAQSLQPAGLLRRAAGLCVDLAPGLMIAVMVFDLDPAAFVEELQAGSPKALLPSLVAMLASTLLTGVLEVVTGRSPGKWVTGTRVAAMDGSLGTRRQRGMRAALRLVLLLFPPVALLGLLDPAGRGLPELMTRTVVLAGGRSEPTAPPAPADETEV